MTEKEMLNEIDHLRRALNSERLKNKELKRRLKTSIELLSVERENSSFWAQTATRLRSSIANLIEKYEQEAEKYEQV